MILLQTILRVLHGKHTHTEVAPSDADKMERVSIDVLCSYIESHSGRITVWCNPITGVWNAVLKDYAGRYLMRANSLTPTELVDKLCMKIERKRLAKSNEDFNDASQNMK